VCLTRVIGTLIDTVLMINTTNYRWSQYDMRPVVAIFEKNVVSPLAGCHLIWHDDVYLFLP